MASENRERLRVVFRANGPELDEKGELERLELIRRIHLLSNGREIKTGKNKKILENIVENLPENCPKCGSDFSRDNFYLIEIFDGTSAEVNAECSCENYRKVVDRYNINTLLKNSGKHPINYTDYRNPAYVGLETSTHYKELKGYLEEISKKGKEYLENISKEEKEYLKSLHENIKFFEELDKQEKKLGLHIKPYGTEVRIVENKRRLVEIIENIPVNCPICKSDFSKDNFYLIEIFDGCGSEIYIECLCENYGDVIVEMR